MNIPANDPSLKSWVEVPAHSDFPIQNLPFGIFRTANTAPRVGIRIGNYILDLVVAHQFDYFDDINFDKKVLERSCLNDFIACGKPVWQAVRQRVSELLQDNEEDKVHKNLGKAEEDGLLVPVGIAEMLMPVKVQNYTDFYSSQEHATNVGSMFRDPANALLPNWKHLPVAYHGRASSIMVSGTPFHRPKGQTKADDAPAPSFGPTRLLDFELEVAFIIGKENAIGTNIPAAEAENHIFGFVLFNDWSARDVQKWEYVPLGPFLAKNFFSSISPWVVTLDALEPFRVESPKQEPEVLPYLHVEGEKNFDIQLEVSIKPENSEESIICRSNFRYMYWNVNQQLAHHTINGCNMQIGDMCASGTISGKEKDSFGSMLELTWGGKNPVQLNDGSERRFIQDHDTVIMRGFAEKDGVRIGFGEVSTLVLPAK